jgi:hypothetical protein
MKLTDPVSLASPEIWRVFYVLALGRVIAEAVQGLPGSWIGLAAAVVVPAMLWCVGGPVIAALNRAWDWLWDVTVRLGWVALALGLPLGLLYLFIRFVKWAWVG